MANNNKWGVLKWTFATAAGAVIGALSVRALDKYIIKEAKKKEHDDELEGRAPNSALVGGVEQQPHPFMNPAYAQALSPVIPLPFIPSYVSPPIPPAPPPPIAPTPRINDEDDDEDDEYEKIRSRYNSLDDDDE